MPLRKKRVRSAIANLRKVNTKRQQLKAQKEGTDKPESSKATEPPADPLQIAQSAQMHMWKTFEEITSRDTWAPSEPPKGVESG